MAKRISAGRIKVIYAFLLLFGPALILILIGTSNCEHVFKELDDYGQLPEYSFTTVDGVEITNADFKDKVVLFNVLQNNCLDTCNIAYWHVNQLIYQRIRKNKNEVNDVRIISVVTDKEGNPIEDVSIMDDMIRDRIEAYDPEVWMIVSGDPKQLYDHEYRGVNLAQKGDKMVGGQSFMQRMLLVDRKNELRMVRSGEIEKYVRDIYGHIALLLKQYDKEAARNRN